MKHYDKIKKELVFLSDYREMDEKGKWSVPKCKWCHKGMKKHSDDCFAITHLEADKSDEHYEAMKAELMSFMIGGVFAPHKSSMPKSGSCIWCDVFLFVPHYVKHEKGCFATLYLDQQQKDEE
jgi:hypothetical protein